MIAKAAQQAKKESTKNAPGVLAEINSARTNPRAYAEHIMPMLRLFSGNVLQQPGRKDLITNEGVDAVNEAVQFLLSAKPLPPLESVSSKLGSMSPMEPR